jgi:hypothetical protein
MKIQYAFLLMMPIIGWAANDIECGVDRDCRQGYSCRSKPHGGTRCVKRESSPSEKDFLDLVPTQNSSDEISTTNEENTCLKVGFKIKTEAFGNCVLELLSRKNDESLTLNEDEHLCVSYGFRMGSENFASCRLQMAQARWQASQQQIQYEEQKKQYENQMEFARNKARQENARRTLDLSLRLLNGQSPTDALLGAGSGVPIAPKLPPPQTIILPGGRLITCDSQINVTTCF